MSPAAGISSVSPSPASPCAARPPPAPPESAADLVGRIRLRDGLADDELVRRYRRGVRIILRAESSDAAAVDDLFQETFRIALEKIRKGEIREPDRLSGFIAALARNLVIAHFRRVAAQRAPSGSLHLATVASPSPDPLEHLLSAERGTTVHDVLANLSLDRDRQILFRFYIAQDEKGAICRDMALASLHFNRVLFRARERYRVLHVRMAKKRPAPKKG